MEPRVGRRHPTLRRLRALRGDPKLRRDEGVFVAEGLHLAEEAVASGAYIELVLYSEKLEQHRGGKDLLGRMAAAGLDPAPVAASVLDSIQDVRSPQPVVTLVRRAPTTLADCVRRAGNDLLLVVAHGLQDPGNLGSLLRTADAAGAAALLATGDGADLYHPRTVRGTMGSIFRLPAVAVDLEAALDAVRVAGLTTVATVPSSVTSATDFRKAELGRGCAVVFGSEGAGLPDAVCKRLDSRIRIPTRQGVESLSVGAAAAVILFEAAHQRRRDTRTACGYE